MKPCSSLAIRRDRGIGDILMLTPALREIDEWGLADVVDVFCDEGVAPLLEGSRRVRMTRPTRAFKKWARDYEQAIDLVGVVERDIEITKISRVEAFARALGVELTSTHTEYQPLRGEILQAQRWLSKLPRPWVVLAPWATDPRRSWAWEQVGAFVKLVLETTEYSLVPTHYEAVAERWFDGERCRPMWGQPVRFVGAVLAQADAVVSVDTGIYHLAVAAGASPLVLPFGSTDAEVQMRPYQHARYEIVRSGYDCPLFPCAMASGGDCGNHIHGECQSRLSPEGVLAALRKVLG